MQSMRPKGRRTPPVAMQRKTVLSYGELLVYLLLVIYFLCVLIYEGWAFCRRLVEQRIDVPGLRPSVLGLKVDLSDPQWRDFRGSMGLLAAVFAGFVALSRTVQAYAPRLRVPYYLAFSLVFLGVLHGACILFVLGLCCASYVLSHLLAGQPYGLLVMWAWHCAVFLTVRVYDGIPFCLLSPALAGLDAHRGMLRWHIHYNLLVLRMLSYAADLHWQRSGRPPRARVPPDTPPRPDLGLRDRAELPLPPAAYCLPTFLAYALYPPLYIAGPILTFNAFGSQLLAPPAGPAAPTAPAAAARYAARGVACWLTLEAMTHGLWFFSVARYRLWGPLAAAEGRPLGALDLVLAPWWMLMLVWCKFLVIWRFFRFWSLADGVEAPENLTRCICANYDIVGFWKGWHSSYNLWLVRYMYIPLGGARWRLLNVWPIFTFVALWHDVEPRMLSWAWLMALIIAPEAAGKWAGAQPWCVRDKGGRAFRYLAAAAGAVNMLFMISVNLVGFVFGPAGIRPLIQGVLGAPAFAPYVLLAVFSAVQLTFALRDAREGRGNGGGGGGGTPRLDGKL
ncbi:MAG: MBOAT, membrane-bound O-acyltransferase family-domain-containing protein [Monoraphidium minutum]|nr:MAG: MBOAT, membrane-bound O-acyltransferase family-domain-containing protein [Monoraphidium minutum]